MHEIYGFRKRFKLTHRCFVYYIHTARQNVLRAVDTEQIKLYWLIGRDIVEEGQKGTKRSEYGKDLLAQLSKPLTNEFGSGFSVSTLTHIRRFYLAYQLNQKSYSVRTKWRV